MKPRFREISIALWTSLAGLAAGCQHPPVSAPNAAAPVARAALARQPVAAPPLVGMFAGLDETLAGADE